MSETQIEKRQRTLIGKVVSNKMDKTVVVQVERRVKHPISLSGALGTAGLAPLPWHHDFRQHPVGQRPGDVERDRQQVRGAGRQLH